MLSRAGRVAVLTGALLLALAGGASAYDGKGGGGGPAPAPVTPEAGGGTIAVTVTSSGSTGEGRSFSSSVQATVAPDCWRAPGRTGYEYYEYWKPGGPARQSGTLDAYAAQGLLNPDFEAYATDDTGRWYEPRCRYDIDDDVELDYLLSHRAVFVPEGEPAPPVDVVVDPQQLVEIAQDHIQLPTGTVRWNPSIEGSGATVVNMDTFVWVEGAPATVEVTASVPGVWARVDASVRSMTLEAPNADTATCPDVGTAYSAGMTSSTCSIVFTRSSANQPVKEGQTLRTATLTATTTWAASWVSSQNPEPQPLDLQTVTTTAEIPVAEIQTVVTR
ncbi:hypothetical protein J1G42_02550 [Cellulomonas sp. zg-ZUI222]|uniref:hypothetical protein n=1 Tax=Cellulomonas wangleii TaxID=2816956 RepID=UPI001A952371|nr:hypothetical protein [Cellulomonas wangleii]MBO0919704.1 hypothetical protein [Cellulomonas wangleii]